MIGPLILLSLCLCIICQGAVLRESPLQCWRCEVTVQVSEKAGVFLDDCQAPFDFTQHTREECDGKCWKSVDLVETKAFGNRTLDGFFRRYPEPFQRKSSRRCFSATELMRAAEMGVNTSDGCRQVRRDDAKMKEVCFCSDQDMCNNAVAMAKHFVIMFVFSFLMYLKNIIWIQ